MTTANELRQALQVVKALGHPEVHQELVLEITPTGAIARLTTIGAAPHFPTQPTLGDQVIVLSYQLGPEEPARNELRQAVIALGGCETFLKGLSASALVQVELLPRIIGGSAAQIPAVRLQAEERTVTLAQTTPQLLTWLELPAPAAFHLAGTLADPDLLPRAIRQVQPAVDRHAEQPAWTGIALRLQDAELTLMAYNGHRLGSTAVPLAQPVAREQHVLLPEKALATWARAREILALTMATTIALAFPRRAQASAAPSYARFSAGALTLITATMREVSLPAPGTLWPADWSTRLQIPARQLLAACRGIEAFARQAHLRGIPAMHLRIDRRSVEIWAGAPRPEEAPAATHWIFHLGQDIDGVPCEATLSPRDLKAALLAAGEQAVVLALAPSGQALIRANNGPHLRWLIPITLGGGHVLSA